NTFSWHEAVRFELTSTGSRKINNAPPRFARFVELPLTDPATLPLNVVFVMETTKDALDSSRNAIAPPAPAALFSRKRELPISMAAWVSSSHRSCAFREIAPPSATPAVLREKDESMTVILTVWRGKAQLGLMAPEAHTGSACMWIDTQTDWGRLDKTGIQY
ncbi:hypothetical protein Vretifemale_480, partial [Volvox reticuliferus]